MKGLHEGRKKGEGEERTKGGGIGGANRSSGSYHTLGADVTQQRTAVQGTGHLVSKNILFCAAFICINVKCISERDGLVKINKPLGQASCKFHSNSSSI